MSEFPIRCFTCGKVITDKWKEYEKMTSAKIPIKEVLDKLLIYRYCCRRMFLGHSDITNKIEQS